jgi:hypothetical protein
MQVEEFGPISDGEVAEAVAGGEIIESYPEDAWEGDFRRRKS